MKNLKGDSIILAIGVATGAILMALAIAMVAGLKTGVLGALLVILIIAVSAFSGWMAGTKYYTRRHNIAAYMKGYREGLEKKTVVIQQPDCNILFRVQEEVNKEGIRR